MGLAVSILFSLVGLAVSGLFSLVGLAVLDLFSLVGLAVLDLDIIPGRLATPEVVMTPIVLRRALSCAELAMLAVLLLLGGAMDIRKGRLFSPLPAVVVVVVVVEAAAFSLPFVLDFLLGRAGRVGGLLMVVPVVRAVSALVRAGVGSVTDGLVEVGCFISVVAAVAVAVAVVAVAAGFTS